MNATTKRNPAAQEWETPDDLFTMINSEFKFGIDCYASDENKKCDDYIDEEGNANEYDWWFMEPCTAAWCNPPYSNPLPVVKKAYEQVCKYPGTVAAVLLNFDSSTKWYQFCVENASEIRIFTKARVKFHPPAELMPEGGVDALPGGKKPSVLVIFRKKQSLAPCHVWHWDWQEQIRLHKTTLLVF